jgi:toxin-antitoxin system PIN domain toxin
VSVTVDTNVLVYASNEADAQHGPARALVERLAAGPDLVYLFWPALMGYLRIVTHPAVLPRPLAPRDAIGNVTALLSLGHVRAPGESDAFWDAFKTTAGDRLRGNEVPDAPVAALMREHGVTTIYTRDRDYRRFDGIQVQDPFA